MVSATVSRSRSRLQSLQAVERDRAVTVRRPVQQRVVDYDDLAVLAEMKVELHRIDAELQRSGESRRGCFRPTDCGLPGAQ